MSPGEWHQQAVIGEFVFAAITLVAVSLINAPYGRYQRPGWGPTMSARLGWVIMESPAVLVFAAIFLLGARTDQIMAWVLFGLWQIHYLNRTFVFPFRLAIRGKQVPVLIVAMAIVFNLLNAWVNAGWIGWFGDYPDQWVTDPRFLLGTMLFFLGMAINRWADSKLIALRRAGDGYQVPQGGLYHWVCCPNYLGEILIWLGWAVATWSWAGLAFAVYTIANLAPRALAHRRWYRETFPDFPADRKALIPHVL